MILAPTLLLLLLLPLSTASDCNQKQFKSGIVCVCDVTQCDEIPNIDLSSGQAATFTTSNSGARLHRDIVYATNSDPVTSLHLTIDSSKRYQTIQGFGSTFSDASGANLKSLPDRLADTVIRQYFSDSGLNLQYARVPIASNDFSSRVYSYNDVPDDYSMTHFALQREDYQWKIPYMQAAQKYNHDLKFFAVPWSAPESEVFLVHWLIWNPLAEGKSNSNALAEAEGKEQYPMQVNNSTLKSRASWQRKRKEQLIGSA
ncbi:hypothetical protein CAEBREN_17689 [Caenorhabditis brenneri]|uniref:Glucosylceramidase n=1 Tax=Caenorhabditis brenneri TaxID=135651 RepID=G0NCZ6_CAEBE|nr:hypothetical protein CAEBREN_17689 [Caenorhabditis brenneri]